MACAICKIRREKRPCPGVKGQICAICCGEQREETIACPLDCEYLQYAHEHERVTKDPAGLPNRDYAIPRNFLEKNVELIMDFQRVILTAALEARAIDNDVRDALAGLVRTYQTLSSGLYYESRPANPMAGAVFDAIQQRAAEIRRMENERGLHQLRDSQIQTALVFLQQMEYGLNNRRARGRCFLSNLKSTLEEMVQTLAEEQAQPGSLIIS
jgi:hypothetical protein